MALEPEPTTRDIPWADIPLDQSIRRRHTLEADLVCTNKINHEPDHFIYFHPRLDHDVTLDSLQHYVFIRGISVSSPETVEFYYSFNSRLLREIFKINVYKSLKVVRVSCRYGRFHLKKLISKF